MEKRNSLVVDVETTHATGTAKREDSKVMVTRTVIKAGATLGADKGSDLPEFVDTMRKQGVTPQAARKKQGSTIDRCTSRHAGYAVSLKIRKRVEGVFGWDKSTS